MIAFIDIETGGFSKEKNALCEIGLVITDNDLNIVQEWQTYIKPYTRLDPLELCSYKDDAMAVNGITMEQLESGIKVRDALTTLYLQIHATGVSKLVGHNIRAFDIPWLKYLYQRFFLTEVFIDIEIDDTLELSRKHLSGSHSLDDICASLGIHKEGHTALGDAKASLELYKHLRTVTNNSLP